MLELHAFIVLAEITVIRSCVAGFPARVAEASSSIAGRTFLVTLLQPVSAPFA